MRLVCPIECNYDQPVHREELPLKKEIYVEWSRNYSDWHRQTFGDLHPQLTVAIMAHLKQFMEQNRYWSIVPLSVANGLINNNGFPLLQQKAKTKILSSSLNSYHIGIYFLQFCVIKLLIHYLLPTLVPLNPHASLLVAKQCHC